MSKRLVVVDSSVWVSHLAGPPTMASRCLEGLLQVNRVAVNSLVRLEVLTGALNEAQYAQLEEAFQGLHLLPLSEAVFRCAERLRFQLRQAGQLIPAPDVLIACCALIEDCELLHADHHFDWIARATPLRIYQRE